MIARPKISRNERKSAEIRAFEVGNFALFCCPALHGEAAPERVARGARGDEGQPAEAEAGGDDAAEREHARRRRTRAPGLAGRGERAAAGQGAPQELAEDRRREVERGLLGIQRQAEERRGGEGPPRVDHDREPQREPQRHAVVLEVAVVDEDERRREERGEDRRGAVAARAVEAAR